MHFIYWYFFYSTLKTETSSTKMDKTEEISENLG